MHEARARCRNCDTELSGGFCYECGQSGADVDVPVGRFAKEFISESFDLDSRLRRTFWPLFMRPGLVPAEYVAGHRARFVPPVRLYIIASFALFFILPFGPSAVEFGAAAEGIDADSAVVGDTVTGAPDAQPTDSARVEGLGELGEMLEERLNEGMRRATADPERFVETILNRLAQAMFFLLPFFAALLKLLYRRRLYMHHLIFGVYYHSFVFFLVAFVSVPEALGWETVASWLDVLILYVPVYLLLAMKRFYGESWPKTLLKGAALGFVYMAVGAATSLAVVVLGLLTG